jgi:integrase/recombinase XerD
LLLNPQGKPFTKRNVSKRFETFSEYLGKKIHPHALRRGFAVLMANLGMPLNQLQLILGHEDIETTMGYVMTNYKHAQKWVHTNLSQASIIVESDNLEEAEWDEIING